MKLLIAIISCKQHEECGDNDAVRETWLPAAAAAGFDTRFFIGQSELVQREDTQMLCCPDDYNSLPHKTQRIAAYALQYGYDFVYKCDRDTYVVPKRLRVCGFQRENYYGHFPLHPVDGSITSPPDGAGHYVYASGGCGYILSRRSMDVIANTEVTDWAEDRWVGDTLAKAGISGYHDRRFWFKPSACTSSDREMIACHLSCGTGNYSRHEMHRVHQGQLQCEQRCF